MHKKMLNSVGFTSLLVGLTLVVGAGCTSLTGPASDDNSMVDDYSDTSDAMMAEEKTDEAMMEEPNYEGEKTDEMMKESDSMMAEEKTEEPEAMMEESDKMMAETAVKEFSMDSFVVFEDGAPKPQFSVKDITVNKGDKVKIKVTVTSGSHNFNIDEFNIHEATPSNEEVVIEFTADKAGEFVYYCSMPGHRANGHWGTLTVVE